MPETARTNGAESPQILDVLKNYVALIQESVPAIEKKVTETRAAVQSEVSKVLDRAAKTKVATKTTARASELTHEIEARVTRARDALLDALGIARKSELGALSRKVNKLAKAVSSKGE
jgi:polyhydroxyalkanoate synthesis regulator phasin